LAFVAHRASDIVIEIAIGTGTRNELHAGSLGKIPGPTFGPQLLLLIEVVRRTTPDTDRKQKNQNNHEGSN